MAKWLLVLSLLVVRPANANDGLDVKAWLSRPGVKLLAVEFYASWCKPCMKAVPRWKKLHEKYRDRGLRLVVVSVQDPDGTCVNPGWNPDDIVCDDEGHLSDAMKVGNNLPAAFLWSWRGNLLVRRGHVEDVAKAVEAELSRLPRVTLDEGMDKDLRRLLRSELARAGKVTVLADRAEREALARIRKESHDLGFSEQTTCRVGEQLAANSLLKAVQSRSGGRERLSLQLFSAETGCLNGSASVGWNASRPEGSVAEAVAEMTDNLRGPVEIPGGARAATLVRKVKEGRIGESVEEWNPVLSQRVVVRFSSTPAGAVVQVDGELVCQSTPCSEELNPGPHSIIMQAKKYEKRAETVAVQRGTEIDWTLTPNFGWVTVTSEPSGLDVKIGKKKIGVTPLRRHEVSIGPYEVLVTSPCHYDGGERVNVERGKERLVNVILAPRQGAIDVSVKDAKGNAVEADVYVDGKKVGRSPGVFKVSICAREVELQHREHGTVKKNLDVQEQAVVRVEAVLEGTGTNIEWVYSKPAGISFARSETTLTQYQGCVEAGKCESKHHKTKSDHKYCNWGYSDRGDHPMNCVSWYGAKQFCAWAGGRLPTEQEWESEASSGGRREYPWGGEKPSCSRCVMDDGGNGCGKNHTWPVCSKRRGDSVSGLCDMSGNVWEWTSSWYDSQKKSRVLRGGSWHSDVPEVLRASNRGRRDPGPRFGNLGFRCVRSSQ